MRNFDDGAMSRGTIAFWPFILDQSRPFIAELAMTDGCFGASTVKRACGRMKATWHALLALFRAGAKVGDIRTPKCVQRNEEGRTGNTTLYCYLINVFVILT